MQIPNRFTIALTLILSASCGTPMELEPELEGKLDISRGSIGIDINRSDYACDFTLTNKTSEPFDQTIRFIFLDGDGNEIPEDKDDKPAVADFSDWPIEPGQEMERRVYSPVPMSEVALVRGVLSTEEPAKLPPEITPEPTATTKPEKPDGGGELQPLGVGADLDSAHEKGGCVTPLGMKDEVGKGGAGELPKAAFKVFGCRDRAGLEVEWTMCIGDPCDAKVYMLVVTVPRVSLFKNALPYLKAFSSPDAMKEWSKVKTELKTAPLAVLRSGRLKLSAMPGQAGAAAGQLVLILSAPGPE